MCVCRVGCGSWLFVRWGLVGGGGVVVEDGQDSRNASPVSTCHGLDVKREMFSGLATNLSSQIGDSAR